ncbi:MAG: sulfotransferase [Anaerolineales bacterium]|nr:sulfotransferase [Anaerolineales bacterium]
MRFNLRLYLKTIQYAFFKAEGTPGRLSPKRFFINLFIFLFYPIWQLSIRIAYLLDNLIYPGYQDQTVREPIFIVGNFRSGTTFLHRLMSKDEQSTSFTSWELYLAPSVVGRHFYRWLMKINYAIGNPAKRIIEIFNRIVEKESYMHKIGLTEVEEDGQIFFHIWSSFHLLAFFPFPNLIKKYIYYDDLIPREEKERDMRYYSEIIKKHIYSHGGRRYISKNPSHSPRVKTLHQQFPDAKFINLVRNPLEVIPSSISLFSKHCHTYGDPETEYALQETVIEHSKHWYLYPHQYLKTLPSDQYIRVRYQDLVSDPKGTVEKIYGQLNIDLQPSFESVLENEATKAKKYKSKHKYSLRKMGLSKKRILNEFKFVIQQYKFDS